MTREKSMTYSGWPPPAKKYPNTKITISQKCANIFLQTSAHLFRRQLCKSVLLCAVFTWHKGEGEGRVLAIAPLTWVTLATKSALQSWKCQLTGMS